MGKSGEVISPVLTAKEVGKECKECLTTALEKEFFSIWGAERTLRALHDRRDKGQVPPQKSMVSRLPASGRGS